MLSEVQSYTDDTQLYFHADPSAVDSKGQKLVTCFLGDIGQWMCANRLKLNHDKLSSFGLAHHTSCLSFSPRRLHLGCEHHDLHWSNVPRRSLLLDSSLTFVHHARRLSVKSFYRAAWNADAVLRWEFRLSVCPSVKRVNCDKTAERYV